MRILLSAQRFEKGAVAENLRTHRDALEQARAEGCALAVFPEMSLTGSVDPATHPERLLALDDAAVAALVSYSGELGVAALFGLAETGPYIAQVLAAGGRIAGVQRKRLLGDGEDAYRAAGTDATFSLGGVPFAVAICAEHQSDRAFAHAHAVAAPLVCFAAAPGLHGRRTSAAGWRAGFDWWCSAGLDDARRHARVYGVWIAIATQAGSTVDEDFPGLAALVDPNGDVVAQTPDWNAGTLVVDVPV